MLEVGKGTKEVLISKHGLSANTAPLASRRPPTTLTNQDWIRPDSDRRTGGFNLACSAGVFVLELAVVSSPPYWLEQSRWGGDGEKRKKTPARKGCENEKHPLISCASQIFRKWLIGQSKWTENYIIFPIKTNTREESTCYLQTSARIERVNYVVQKCRKRTLMINCWLCKVSFKVKFGNLGKQSHSWSENLFKPSKRQDCFGVRLPEICSQVGLKA